MIKEVTNQIIEDYLDFSGKDKSCITANEYLMFRDRAEEEIKRGINKKREVVQLSKENTIPFSKPEIEKNTNTVPTAQVSPIPIKTDNPSNISNLFALAQKISG